MLDVLNERTEAGWANRTFLADHSLKHMPEGCGSLEAYGWQGGLSRTHAYAWRCVVCGPCDKLTGALRRGYRAFSELNRVLFNAFISGLDKGPEGCTGRDVPWMLAHSMTLGVSQD